MKHILQRVLLYVLAALILSLLPGCESTVSNQPSGIPSQSTPSTSVEQEETSSESNSSEIPLPDPVPDPVSDPIPDQSQKDPMAQMESASLQYPSQNDMWKYNVYDCYVEITDYVGERGSDAVMPAELDGMPVWKICDKALANSKINSLQLPDGLVEIGSQAFSKSSISEINLPESLVTIGNYAFEACENLNSITVPENLKEIPRGMCVLCENLSEVNIPEGITEIPYEAFEGCKNLSNITIPASVTEIGEAALARSGLSAIKIPGNVKKIWRWAFSECTKLSQVDIEEGVEVIDYSAFYYCIKLSNVILPKSLKEIGLNAGETYGVFRSISEGKFDLYILNPDVNIGTLFGLSNTKQVTIHGYAGSTAAQYCADKNITFQLIT